GVVGAEHPAPERGRAGGRAGARGAPRTAVPGPVTRGTPPATPTWNVLVTAYEGQREALRTALWPLGRFRRAGYPNVLVATVDDPLAFLGRLAQARATSADLAAALARAVPIERAVRFAGPGAFVDAMVDAVTPVLDRLVGQTFFVRVLRRGFRGAIDSTSAEREIGGRLVALLESRG